LITGGKILSASAERFKDGQVKGLSVHMDIGKLEEDEKNLKVTYTCTFKYDEGIAEIVVKGELFALEDVDRRKKVLDDWKKNKLLTSDFAEEVLTAINYASASTGTLLAYSVGLGAPLNVPRARVEEAPKDKKPSKAG